VRSFKKKGADQGTNYYKEKGNSEKVDWVELKRDAPERGGKNTLGGNHCQ